MRSVRLKRFILLLLLGFVCVSAFAALKPEYRRNGECYLLIGEGPVSMRGIYRLNNPEANKYFDPPKYLFKPDSSIGFSVDLDRKIYTFSEKVVPGYVLLGEPLKRQVLDSGSTDLADYGYHQYVHYDHRSWGKNTDIYRTGPVGRGIRRSGGSTWPYFKSAGPGKAIAAPSGNPLPDVPSIPLGIYSGKSWYEIPNGAWFSSWRTKPCQSSRPGPAGYFYVVYGDKVEGQPHNWTLYTYTPDNVAADAPNYTSAAGQVVAVSYDKKISRQIFAGCIDGCGGASGSGGGVADPMITDLAFMPPIKSQPSRTYFYSRPVGDINYTVTKNKNIYAPPNPTGNPIIGTPASQDTYWIGVSMRDVSSDYVYCIGTNDIKNWYKQATTSTAPSMSISAVAVSNQWNQKGGIIFAYDKPAKMVYKFIRYENDPNEPPISKTRYEGIDVSDLVNLIQAEANSEIDDIKADGFGSLFFAMTYPSKNVATYDPRSNFKLNDTIRLYYDPNQDPAETEWSGWLIYRQQYGKAVFERSIYSSTPQEIGRKVFAERYYNLNIRMAPEGLAQLAISGPFPNGNVEPILASWSAKIGNGDAVLTASDFSYGSLGLYYEYNYGDPGRAKLAVINVPTPPEVISLAGKKSFLDICGPYTDIPISTDINSTMQNQNLIKPAPSILDGDQIYYFMVENYPLTTGAWNPNDQPDWDGDSRQGGFITSISDTNSSTNGGSVAYRWRTWMVEDMFQRPVFPPEPYPATPSPRDGSDTGQENFTFFYTPVGGKYIITCQVIYDWYDYDLLNFGDTIDDLPAIFRPNVKAVPAAAGASVLQSASSQLSSIMTTNPFKFMQASATQYIDYITEKVESGIDDPYYACYPIVAAGIATPPTYTYQFIANIDRCDGWFPNDKDDASHWVFHDKNWPEADHGLEAGKQYFWRTCLASQSAFFADISKTTGAGVPYRNFIVDMMQNPHKDSKGRNNPLFVNDRDNIKFDNKGDDLRWLEKDNADNAIRLNAYLEYQVPDVNGDPKMVKLQLLASGSNALPLSFPINASTSMDLPPTDPFIATLTIEMSRWISYDMWVKNKNGVDMFPVRNLPKEFKVSGKTNVLIVDRQAPKILYDFTNPVNLFADAGFPLAQGVGPNGGNPASITFRLSDNNPWEAVDSVCGITNNSLWAQNFTHNNTAPTKAPTATFNYKPVFAKALKRRVSLSFDRACRLDSGKVMFFPPDQSALLSPGQYRDFADSFGELYVHKYVLSGTSAVPSENRLQKDFQSTKETVGLSTKYFATIGFRMPLSFIMPNSYASTDAARRRLPKGYANNTPGYDDGGKIRPYKFYLSATDSSGNALSNKMLNIALHPRDVHKPEPHGFFTEFKGNTTTYFPIWAVATDSLDPDNSTREISGTTLSETFFDSNDWLPGADGKINSKDATNHVAFSYKSLPKLSDDIVTDYNSSHADYAALVATKLPPMAIEDNVEFSIGCGVSDNAGLATATLTFKYFDNKENEVSRSVVSRYTSAMEVAPANTSTIKIASTTFEVRGLFRGKAEQFPMSIPVTIIARDNARDWDYYTGKGGTLVDVNNPWSDWKWGSFHKGGDKNNVRNFETSIPVFGSSLIIRTIDKGVRNK